MRQYFWGVKCLEEISGKEKKEKRLRRNCGRRFNIKKRRREEPIELGHI